MGLGFLSNWFSDEPKVDTAEIARKAKAEADYQQASKDLKGYENKFAFAKRAGTPKVIQKPVAPKQNIQRQDLLNKALIADKYNRDNKYKVNGLNLSNRAGDYIGDIANRLFGR